MIKCAITYWNSLFSQLGVQELLKLAGGDDLCVFMGKQLAVSTGILTKNGKLAAIIILLYKYPY